MGESIKHVPSSIGTNRPFHLEPGMHHMEKLDSCDSLEDNLQENKSSPRTKEKVKKQRL
jgi:hypothetical protein